MKTRLYAVTLLVGKEERQHLVDATNKHVAVRHVAAKYAQAQIADGKTVSLLMNKGIKPESASDDTETAELAAS